MRRRRSRRRLRARRRRGGFCPKRVLAERFASSSTSSRPGDYEKLQRLLAHPKGVAVGEIGLDYHYADTDPARQKRAFVEQMELAHALKLPFIVHSRDAAADTLAIFRQNKPLLEYGAVMHCFSGSPETAAEYLKLGLYISFAGPEGGQ